MVKQSSLDYEPRSATQHESNRTTALAPLGKGRDPAVAGEPGMGLSSEAGKRVGDLQPFKPGEVPVSGNEFRDAMLEAESYNVRVMNEIACGPRLANGSIEHGGMPPGLRE